MVNLYQFTLPQQPPPQILNAIFVTTKKTRNAKAKQTASQPILPRYNAIKTITKQISFPNKVRFYTNTAAELIYRGAATKQNNSKTTKNEGKEQYTRSSKLLL